MQAIFKYNKENGEIKVLVVTGISENQIEAVNLLIEDALDEDENLKVLNKLNDDDLIIYSEDDELSLAEKINNNDSLSPGRSVVIYESEIYGLGSFVTRLKKRDEESL